MRSVLIFGNGLGRALDNEFFSLERALNAAWKNPEILSSKQKELICQCLSSHIIENEEGSAPRTEDELDVLQRILAACDEIASHQQSGRANWLTPEGKEFPQAIRKYIHAAAREFHGSPHSLPGEFIDGLKSHILQSRSHVATLDYDPLLYNSFLGTEVFKGFNCLIDGFSKKGFDKFNLNRRIPNKTSFYLHLHGSPLFVTDDNETLKKLNSGQSPEITERCHIVLTHTNHKASVISASEILGEYWKRLREALDEVDAVLFFGYGGGDLHLNRLVGELMRKKTVAIVRRASSRAIQEIDFDEYFEKLGNFKVLECGNILDFRNWDLVGV